MASDSKQHLMCQNLLDIKDAFPYPQPMQKQDLIKKSNQTNQTQFEKTVDTCQAYTNKSKAQKHRKEKMI